MEYLLVIVNKHIMSGNNQATQSRFLEVDDEIMRLSERFKEIIDMPNDSNCNYPVSNERNVR